MAERVKGRANGRDDREFTSEWIEVPPEKRPIIRGQWQSRDLEKDRKMFWWVVVGVGLLLVYMFVVGVLAVLS